MRVELILDDRNLDLVDEELDVGIRIGTLTGSGLVARRVGDAAPLIASPAYVARRGLPKHPKDLLNHDLIYVGRPQKPEWRFRGAAPSERVVRLQPCLAVNEIDAMLLAVGEGRGSAGPSRIRSRTRSGPAGSSGSCANSNRPPRRCRSSFPATGMRRRGSAPSWISRPQRCRGSR